MADSTQAPQNMPLHELLHRLMALSDDPQAAGRLIILNGDGSYIGETTLSEADIAAASQALDVFLAARECMESALAAPLSVDQEAVDEVLGQFEKLLGGDL